MSQYKTTSNEGTISGKEAGDVLPSINTEDENLIPSVRYGRKDGGQYPELHLTCSSIPGDVNTVSPIYYLTENQLERQDSLSNPYETTDVSCIAKELQDNCEKRNRVLYPVVVESDTELNLDDMAESIIRFLEENLNLTPTDYTLWYSGGRSIHAHTSLFVDSNGLKQVKETVKEFNQDSEVTLDTSNYSRKSQFRLPGVKHDKTGGVKVKVNPGWDHEEIFSKAHSKRENLPDTYLDALAEVLPHDNTQQSGIISQDEVNNQGPLLPSEIVPFYNRHFSPYANADKDDLHSVAILKVLDDQPHELHDEYFVGAAIFCAVGGGGREDYLVSKKNDFDYRHIKLSTHDAEKWDYEMGDIVAILGGRSRRSRIFEIDIDEAKTASRVLYEDGREAAIRHFSAWGYDVGSTGLDGEESLSISDTSRFTEAARLKQEIDEQGLPSVVVEEGISVHDLLFKVSCRLLKIRGWGATWDWLRHTLGDNFEPEETHKRLKKIVETYSEDYRDVDVPPRP